MTNKYDHKKNNAKIVAGAKAPKAKRVRHPFGDARDNPDFRGNRSTMPARQRPGKVYAGGRPLRRAQARLASNQKGCLEARAVAGRASGKNHTRGENSLKMPGAMHP